MRTSWTHVKQNWCCEHANVGCPLTTTKPLSLGLRRRCECFAVEIVLMRILKTSTGQFMRAFMVRWHSPFWTLIVLSFLSWSFHALRTCFFQASLQSYTVLHWLWFEDNFVFWVSMSQVCSCQARLQSELPALGAFLDRGMLHAMLCSWCASTMQSLKFLDDCFQNNVILAEPSSIRCRQLSAGKSRVMHFLWIWCVMLTPTATNPITHPLRVELWMLIGPSGKSPSALEQRASSKT